MRSDLFNSLLKYSEIEHECSDDFYLRSDQDDDFVVRFHYSSGNVFEWPEFIHLSGLQKERIQQYIYNWCDDRRKEIKNPIDYKENGLFGYGY